MRIVRYIILLYFAAAAACVPAMAQNAPVTIPFVFEHNKIFIDGVYIGSAGPYRATLDTGTSDVIIDPAIADKLGLNPISEASARATGGTVKVFKVKSPAIKAGAADLLPGDITISVTPVSDQSAPFEEPTDLVIGYPLFRRYIVEIDYTGQKLILHEPAGFTPPKDAAALDINLSTNLPVAKIEIEGNEAAAMLDTGSNSALDTYPEFMDRTGLAKGHSLYAVPVVGMGGAVLTNLMRLKSVKLAGNEFTGVRIYAHTRQLFYSLDALVGNEILRRYNVVFDYPRGKAYLTPGAGFNSPMEEERAGIVVLNLAGKYTVATVVTGGPADKAGVKAEDIIVGINGEPAVRTGVSGLRKLVRGEPGEKIQLSVTRAGKTMPFEITLEDYVK